MNILVNVHMYRVRVVGVYVLVYARTHTQTTWVLDVSPGVGQTPGGPEESNLPTNNTVGQHYAEVLTMVQVII